MEKDLGLVGDQYQIAVSVLFVTYCVRLPQNKHLHQLTPQTQFFEVSSNLVIKKPKPSRYIAAISVVWGIIPTLTGITQNYNGLIACRISLGVVEAGLFPGFMTYLTLFYSKREIALRGYGILISDTPSGVHYFGAILVASGLYVAVGLPLTWLPANLPRYGKRTFATGLQLTFGNVSGVMSSFLYKNDEAPRYVRGNAATLGLVGFAGVLYGVMWCCLRVINRSRVQGFEDDRIVSLSEEEVQELGDRNPRFMYST